MDQWIVTGQPASDGIAVGTAVLATSLSDSGHDPVTGSGVRYTLDNFHAAIRLTQEQLHSFQQGIQERITEPVALLFSAHHLILADRDFSGRMAERISNGTLVPEAINQVTEEYINYFLQSTNPRCREKIDDLEDIRRRLLRNLSGATGRLEESDYHQKILITTTLFPSDIMRLVAQNVEGIILTSAGLTAHIAVLARSLGVPLILADASALAGLTTGTPLLMDAHAGRIFVNPGAKVLSAYNVLGGVPSPTGTGVESLATQTSTRDGMHIRLLAAVGLISEARLAHEREAEGLGLYRSEISFLIRNTLPSEEEQYAVYRRIMTEMPNGEVVFRTLDIGGDKILSYFPVEEESNPFLGLRGLRFTFEHREVFRGQIRAVLRSAYDRPLRIIFPLVSSVDSFTHARELVRAVIGDLGREGIPHQLNPQFGAMIELPCAVTMADELAAEADFLSIGTSDLLQYMLAVDRTNKQVAGWYVPWHPAVLRAVKSVVDAASRHDKPLSLCGEMADDLTLIPVLVGMGVKVLTIPPRRFPQVQRVIQSIELPAAKELAEKILKAGTVAETARLLGIAWVFPGADR